MMQEKDPKELLRKVIEGSASEEEIAMLESWYFTWREDLPSGLSAAELEMAKNSIYSNLPQPVHVSTIKLWSRIAGIAAGVAFIVFGIYFISYINRSNSKAAQDVAVNDVAPGSIGASLTLATGKIIRLTDAANGEIAKEAGISISKTADGQLVYEVKGSASAADKINILSTAKGETYQVKLPDGSLVYLNAASNLTYSSSLVKNGKRMVKLQGEGYFEIAKDKAHPFVVRTDKQEVEVLGTHFNVNAYLDEPAIATTLLEGSVKITSGNIKQVLKPGQQAWNKGTEIQVRSANVAEATAWKDGDFHFNEEKLSSIIKKLERWYDVEILLNEKLANEELSGKISRNRNISRVLKMIEKANNIQFKIEGRRIIATEK